MKKLFLIIISIFIQVAYAAPLKVVTNFDSSKYLGKWYELARLPNSFEKKCTVPISATYSINPKNSNQIIVVNSCMTKQGKQSVARGVADFVESQSVGKLEVTFLPKLIRWIPFTSGDYWILSVDYDKLAVVGSPDRQYLWILSRSIKNVDKKAFERAVAVANSQGFDVGPLIIHYPKELTESDDF